MWMGSLCTGESKVTQAGGDKVSENQLHENGRSSNWTHRKIEIYKTNCLCSISTETRHLE